MPTVWRQRHTVSVTVTGYVMLCFNPHLFYFHPTMWNYGNDGKSWVSFHMVSELLKCSSEIFTLGISAISTNNCSFEMCLINHGASQDSFLLPDVLRCHTTITSSSIYKIIDRLNAFHTSWLDITMGGLAGNTSKDKLSLRCLLNIMRYITTQNYHRLSKMTPRKLLTAWKLFLSVCINAHHSVFTALCLIQSGGQAVHTDVQASYTVVVQSSQIFPLKYFQ